MSIITTITTPNNDALTTYHQVVTSMSAKLLPTSHAEKIHVRSSAEDGLLTAVLGTSELVEIRGNSILAGVVTSVDADKNWWQLREPAPDGVFVLFRSDRNRLEFVTDYAGSRPIWYAKLPCGGFAASTCFELVIALLGSFELDDESLGWFLSSGNCGPGRSWDKRVKPVSRNTRLCVTRTGTEIEVWSEMAAHPEKSSAIPDDKSVAGALDEALAGFETDRHGWLLALSGGCDSRALLHGIRNMDDVDCITWTDANRRAAPRSDVEIATQLVAKTGRNHTVSNIKRPGSPDDFDAAMRRFVRFSDGRTDDFIAYIDGMRVWDDISKMDGKALLRGDEVFGSMVTRNSMQILRNMRLTTFSDFPQGEVQHELAGTYKHTLPEDLSQRPGETLSAWRWRLRLEFEIPTVYSALNNIRNRFIESICPLLTRRVISIAESMSDSNLDNKSQFKRVVGGMFPDVPFAQGRVTLYRDEAIRLDPVRQSLREHLSDTVARDILGNRVATIAAAHFDKLTNDGLDKVDSAFGRMQTAAASLTRRVRDKLVQRVDLELSEVVMRSYIARLQIEEMNSAAEFARSTQKTLRLVSA